MAVLSIAESRKQGSDCRGKPGYPQTSSPRYSWLIACLLVLLAPLTSVFADAQVDRLLAGPDAPGGVVFEIVESDDAALEVLIPRVREAIERIRQKFPHTDFAVVSHGSEQFALQSQYRQELAPIHQQVQALVADDVPVHVCETHASWYGVTPEDFPEYVDVAPSGPSQVNLYRELGYHLILVDLDN